MPLYTEPKAAAGASAHDFLFASLGLGLAGHFLTGGIKDAFHVWAQMGKIEGQMRLAHFSEDDIKMARDAALAIEQKTHLPAGPVGAMQAQLELGTLTQNPQAVRAMLPDYIRAATLFGAVGKGDELESLFKAVQAGELKGVADTPEHLQGFLSSLVALGSISGGRVGPAQFLQFMRSGGLPAVGLNMDNIGQLLPAILSLGSAQAGTALQGTFREFGAGRLSKMNLEELQAMGIIADPSKIGAFGMGHYQLLPGALNKQIEHDIDTGDYYGFYEHTKAAVHAYNMKLYGRDDELLRAKTYGEISSNIPGMKFLGDLDRNEALSARYDKALHGQLFGPDGKKITPEQLLSQQFGAFADNNPFVQQARLQASKEGFMATLGNPAVTKRLPISSQRCPTSLTGSRSSRRIIL